MHRTGKSVARLAAWSSAQKGKGGVMTAATKPCAECGGGGRCNSCSGTGVDVGVAVAGGSEVDCERCGGTGACPVCGGTGQVTEDDAGGETSPSAAGKVERRGLARA
jgi:hypothetical protein